MLTIQDLTELKRIFATKQDLKNFATKKDLKRLEDKFASKKDLKRLEEKIEEKFMTKDDFHTHMNRVMTMLDAVMGELKAMREELALTNYHVREHSDQLENHEGRITHVESCLTFPD